MCELWNLLNLITAFIYLHANNAHFCVFMCVCVGRCVNPAYRCIEKYFHKHKYMFTLCVCMCVCLVRGDKLSPGLWQKKKTGIKEMRCHLVSSNLYSLCIPASVCVCVRVCVSYPPWAPPKLPRVDCLDDTRVPGVNLGWWGHSVCEVHISFEYTDTHTMPLTLQKLSPALSEDWWAVSQHEGQGQDIRRKKGRKKD